MKPIIEKLAKLVMEIEADKGELSFFAFLLRDDSPDRWDLVIAASWLRPEDGAYLKFVSDWLVKNLSHEELITVARVVFVPPDAPAVQLFSQFASGRFDGARFSNNVINGILIRDAYVFVSTPTSLTFVTRA